MKSKTLLLLLGALAIGVIAYYFNSDPIQQSADANTHLIPDLVDNLNSVSKFAVTESGGVLLSEVSKSENGWVVDNRDGYQANIAAVRLMLTGLADAKLAEAKTSNPDNYSKLGVEDVSHIKAQGVLFTLEGLDGVNDIIFGNNGSSGKNTQYVRRKDGQQSWLINKKLNIKRAVTDWLQKDILDIPPERIKSVQIQHPDSEIVNIANDGEEEYEYTLDASIPEDMSLSESEIYQVANALSSLQLRDVATFSTLNTESIVPVVTIFKTFDGLTITTKAYTLEIDKYFTVEVEFSAADVDLNIVNNENQTESTSDSALKSDPKAAAELAEKSKQRLNGWAYLFPNITQDALTKKLDNFFIPKEAG
ncbi:MAG: DUF4340 domain-containing protein [Gammaproteobacteria bacterium]|nr:MAG: DUF4340 domain-containing protein [Gammaproteobacteria bacterium]